MSNLYSSYIARVILILSFICKTDSNITLSYYIPSPHVECINDVKVDTPYGFNDINQISKFVRYIKTQSNLSNEYDELRLRDVYYVIQTIINRMKDKKCIDFNQYFNTPSINHSHSIKMLKTGRLRTSFNTDNYNDRTMIHILYMVIYDVIPAEYKLDNDVLYFHSFKRYYNRPPHIKSKFLIKARHKFYCK